MKSFRLMTCSVAFLLAVALVAAGCGKPASPPPGASTSTDSPEVEPGTEVETVEAVAEESAATADAPPAPEETSDDAAGGWATLTGRIVYDGTPPESKLIQPTKDPEVCGKHEIPDETLIVSEDGGLANAIVTLRTKNVEVAPSYASAADEKVVLDNKDCRFVPHVALVQTGQEVSLINSDPVGHNSKIDPFLNPGINPILPAGGDPVNYHFDLPEAVPVHVGCNIHPWMGAWLLVRDNPYAAISDTDGKFTIKDLPAGEELEFAIWQENPGWLRNASYKDGETGKRGRFKITLKAGENDLGDIKVSPSIFKK